MTKIRENLSTFFSIFAGVFVVYIVLDWGMDITGRRHRTQTAEASQIGKINGQPVTYREFEELVKQTADNQKSRTGTDPDEGQMNTIRDQVWTQLVDDRLYQEASEKMNLTVTDEEIVDWVRGENPPDFLKQRFIDSTGTFNRALYDQTILDPRNKTIMISVEDFLRKQRLREKLESVILASIRVSEEEIRQRFADQNVKYKADYVLFDPSTLRDTTLRPTEDELKKYYSDNSDQFKTEATRKLKYIVFPDLPSKSDTDGVIKELEDVKQRALQGADFIDLQKTYSELPAADKFFKHGEFSPEREAALTDAKVGDLIGPIAEPNGYHLVKVLEYRNGTDEAIHASHILIRIQNNDTAAALKKARDLTARAKNGEDFAQLAKQNSADATAARGGDLGWFTKGRMVKQFEDVALKMKPGQIAGPVLTPYGYHVIKVIARDAREVKVSDLLMAVHIGPQTKSDNSQRAKDFAYLAKDGSFQKEAEQSKYTIQETQPFQKDAFIPGIGMNNAVNKFAFKNKVGSVSDAFTLANGYGVFMVTEAKDAGIRPYEDVRTAIESQVSRQKKLDVLRRTAADLLQQIPAGQPLTQISAKRPDLQVQHLESFSAGTFIPGIGRDNNFVGAVSALKQGEISKPFEGQRGIYLVQLTERTGFDTTAFLGQHDLLRTQILNEKKNRVLTNWTDELKKSADIVDNRDQFYR